MENKFTYNCVDFDYCNMSRKWYGIELQYLQPVPLHCFIGFEVVDACSQRYF
jgi:hypothetical protein